MSVPYNMGDKDNKRHIFVGQKRDPRFFLMGWV